MKNQRKMFKDETSSKKKPDAEKQRTSEEHVYLLLVKTKLHPHLNTQINLFTTKLITTSNKRTLQQYRYSVPNNLRQISLSHTLSIHLHTHSLR